MAAKKSAVTKRKNANGKATAETKAKISADALPRRSLEKCIEVARTLRSVFAGKSVNMQELAQAMKLSVNNTDFKYALWSSTAYGIVNAEGPNRTRTYSLAENGRKIVAENYPGEAQEAKIKAVLTPTVLSQFFADYNGNPIPPTDEHLGNVLENRFNVPRDRIPEAIEIIKANGKYAGILEDQGDGQPAVVRLSNAPIGERILVPSEATTINGSPSPDATVVIPSWDKTCFFITPIGDDNSEERRHANMMLNHVVRPVFAQYGFTVVRADEIAKTGLISQQIFQYLAKAKICVADLSFHNPNAFYELGVRHAFLLPTIQIIHKSKKIPFDLSQGRTITIDTSDSYMVPDHLESAKKTLAEYVKNLIEGNPNAEDNPVAVYLPEVKVALPK